MWEYLNWKSYKKNFRFNDQPGQVPNGAQDERKGQRDWCLLTCMLYGYRANKQGRMLQSRRVSSSGDSHFRLPLLG